MPFNLCSCARINNTSMHTCSLLSLHFAWKLAWKAGFQKCIKFWFFFLSGKKQNRCSIRSACPHWSSAFFRTSKCIQLCSLRKTFETEEGNMSYMSQVSAMGLAQIALCWGWVGGLGSRGVQCRCKLSNKPPLKPFSPLLPLILQPELALRAILIQQLLLMGQSSSPQAEL